MLCQLPRNLFHPKVMEFQWTIFYVVHFHWWTITVVSTLKGHSTSFWNTAGSSSVCISRMVAMYAWSVPLQYSSISLHHLSRGRPQIFDCHSCEALIQGSKWLHKSTDFRWLTAEKGVSLRGPFHISILEFYWIFHSVVGRSWMIVPNTTDCSASTIRNFIR